MSALDFANYRVFGNAAFRPQQREVIQAVMQARTAAGFGVGQVPEPRPSCRRARLWRTYARERRRVSP